MKKVLLFMFTLFLITGCEKDIKLSEFVIGNWKSQQLNLGDSPLGYFDATMKTTNKYVLKFTLSDGSASLTCPETGYSVNDETDELIITQPDFDPNDGVTPTETQKFKVE
jgi:hypothetical protein